MIFGDKTAFKILRVFKVWIKILLIFHSKLKTKTLRQGCSLRFFSFDFHAKDYLTSCNVQKFFARQLAQKISQKWGKSFSSVLDLGCGTGNLFEAMQQEGILIGDYRGCDISQAMLECFRIPHLSCKLIHQDFDECLIQDYTAELIVSSSALQWSLDLPFTLSLIARHQSRIALSLMNSHTFESLHTFLGTKSPLIDAQNMQESLLEFFNGEIEVSRQEFTFNDSRDLILHLRRSGVLGGGVAGYKKARKLLSYTGKLEYESFIFLGYSKLKK